MFIITGTYKLGLWYLLIVLIDLINYSSTHACGVDKMSKINLHINNSTSFESKRFLQSTTYQPIRIFFDYTTMDSQTSIDINLRNNIKTILVNSQSIFQNILNVKRSSTKLKVSSCDSSVQISPTVQNIGVDADVVVFPFIDTSTAGSTEAYASACSISQVNNRPVAGLIGFTLNTNTNKLNWLNYYTILATHELTHVLVFSPNLFDYFIDANGNTLAKGSAYSTTTINGLTRTIIVTPKVIAAAQKHFGCTSIIGMELENQGGQGTAGSHWEARTMLSDYMIGLAYDEPAISEMTLAFFEDSGWYQANYFTGGLYRYGKGDGCGFLNTKCINSTFLTNYPDVFCTTPNAAVCAPSKTTKAFCYMNNYQNLNSSYQYFSDPTLGGLALSDYCPVPEVGTNSTAFLTASCQIGFSQFSSDFEENISSTSGCFLSTMINNNYASNYATNTQNAVRSICYKFSCDNTNNVVIITIGFTVFTCPKAGGPMTNPGYTGSVTCPDYNSVCTSATFCANMIDCALNKIMASSITDTYTYNKTTANTNTATPPVSASTAATSQTGTTGQTATTSQAGTTSQTGTTSTTPQTTGTPTAAGTPTGATTSTPTGAGTSAPTGANIGASTTTTTTPVAATTNTTPVATTTNTGGPSTSTNSLGSTTNTTTTVAGSVSSSTPAIHTITYNTDSKLYEISILIFLVVCGILI